ncbi:hypothetical protein AYO21_04415 [Fonsecaea monophora]|uniref:RBR-type E3 ubiquitin transferase n=1 Tax=Fonsecaea monophora TaxID=254056 RepID=A0A177FB12_9EURO|nr:hypothetical protein AYO21_04415 [Fonsecaea monophora]OAG41473.1 hypothetical protein AYO21_04415 [Fonsecaea monophora]
MADIDAANAALAVQLELQDLETSLTTIPSNEEKARIRDRVATLHFQLEELAIFDTQQANARLQQSIYRAMLSDFPEVDRILAQETHATNGKQNQQPEQRDNNSATRVVGKDGYYEDPRIQPDGSTSLEAYVHDLEADEVHSSAECYACMGNTPYSQLISHEECEHLWCRPCLLERFELVLKNESQYPVRCCRRLPIISHQNPTIVRLLGEESVAKLELKIKEYTTTDRTYCHDPTCSTFIDPDTFADRMATCPSCQKHTCVMCKAEFHSLPTCNESQDRAFNDWVTANEASTCPNCHRVIIISHGCNHMRCHCGTEFCYNCNAPWKTCQCQQWREDRLLQRAEAIAVLQDRTADVQRIIAEI